MALPLIIYHLSFSELEHYPGLDDVDVTVGSVCFGSHVGVAVAQSGKHPFGDVVGERDRIIVGYAAINAGSRAVGVGMTVAYYALKGLRFRGRYAGIGR